MTLAPTAAAPEVRLSSPAPRGKWQNTEKQSQRNISGNPCKGSDRTGRGPSIWEGHHKPPRVRPRPIGQQLFEMHRRAAACWFTPAPNILHKKRGRHIPFHMVKLQKEPDTKRLLRCLKGAIRNLQIVGSLPCGSLPAGFAVWNCRTFFGWGIFVWEVNVWTRVLRS